MSKSDDLKRLLVMIPPRTGMSYTSLKAINAWFLTGRNDSAEPLTEAAFKRAIAKL